jgi:1-deoxy-D-xylulose-5-phosphate reductoisomerase
MTLRVSLLGATGSIGTSTLNVVDLYPDHFKIVALSAHNDALGLAQIAKKYNPELVAISNPEKEDLLRTELAGTNIKVVSGAQGLIEVAQVDAGFIMAAIVGFAGLAPTLEALKQGTRVGLANKECLVAAGALFMNEARKYGTRVLPVDSEHNAALQLI